VPVPAGHALHCLCLRHQFSKIANISPQEIQQNKVFVDKNATSKKNMPVIDKSA
jgi:hypothetical protein